MIFFIGFIVVWATVNSSYSYCPLEYTGQREHGVCPSSPYSTFSALHVSVYVCIVSTALAVRDGFGCS